MMESKTTTDHDKVMKWAEKRGGHPARVKGTDERGRSGVLVIDYPGYPEAQPLEPISWGEFFRGFEENKLALLYQDETDVGDESRFSKLVQRDAETEMRDAASA